MLISAQIGDFQWDSPTRLGSSRRSGETGFSRGRHRARTPPDSLSGEKTLKSAPFLSWKMWLQQDLTGLITQVYFPRLLADYSKQTRGVPTWCRANPPLVCPAPRVETRIPAKGNFNHWFRPLRNFPKQGFMALTNKYIIILFDQQGGKTKTFCCITSF